MLDELEKQIRKHKRVYYGHCGEDCSYLNDKYSKISAVKECEKLHNSVINRIKRLSLIGNYG